MRIKLKVGEVEISKNNKIIVNVTEFKTKDKIDIRSWFLNSEGEWIPTKRGITFEFQHKDSIMRLLALIDNK